MKTKEQALEIFDLDKSEDQISKNSDQFKILFLIDRKISEISEYLKYLHDNLREQENHENEILKWKYAVIVMDRFFLVMTCA
jgi:hypothetical protein